MKGQARKYKIIDNQNRSLDDPNTIQVIAVLQNCVVEDEHKLG